jgi:DNA-binding LacI/PurR family transcriptional regulator
VPDIPQRQSLLGQTVASIRLAITTGAWGDFLPAERRLCDDLKISRSTLRRALSKVEAEGLIESGSSGRRRKITYSGEIVSNENVGKTKNKKVIWITRLSLAELPSITLRLIALLQNKLSAQRCLVDVVRVPERVITNPEQYMADWLNEYEADVWVLHWMPVGVQKWFQDNQRLCCILGSPGDGVLLPSIEIDSLAAMRHSLALLQRKGHRHIGLVREDSQLVGEIYTERILHEQSEGRFIASVYLCSKDPYLIGEEFEKRWAVKEHRPTALVCTLPHLALYALSWLQKNGIRVPEDMSIITLRSQPILDYCSTSIAHYALNEELAISELTPRLLDLLSHQTCASAPINLIPEFVSGDSCQTYSSSQ